MLYASTRDDLAAWLGPERDVLLDLQFRAQRRDWEQRFPGAEHDVVLLEDVPIGRSWVAWTAAECRIVDLAVLPSYRSSGLGSTLAGEILERADRAGLPVRISVLRLNSRAIAFWTLLGFEPTGSDEMYASFEHRAGES